VLTRWTISSQSGASVKWEIYRHAFASWAVPCCGMEAASLSYAIAYVALWGATVIFMYRRRVFLGV
jgi:predicted acyltransferase